MTDSPWRAKIYPYMATRRVSLTIDIPKGEPPTEIRLLRAGRNASTKGEYLFDAQAASDVMALWDEHTRDLDHPGMVDLEHLSLDPKADNFDSDARAWFDLEVRDGELWMFDIKWLVDGERRVRERLQRFLSPTFLYDSVTRRISELFNVGLTSQPSLHGAPELIAARRAALAEGEPMAEDSNAAVSSVLKALKVDPKLPAKVAAALGLDAGASLDDIRAALDKFAATMAQVEALLAGGDPADDAPAAEAPAAEAPAAEAPVAPMAAAPAPAAEEEEEKPVVAAASRAVETELVALRAFKVDTETAERLSLVRQMVSLGREAPATAYANDDATEIAEPWLSMPLAALRDRVGKLAAAPAGNVPPVSGSVDPNALNDDELAACRENNITPERFLQARALHRGSR